VDLLIFKKFTYVNRKLLIHY